MGINDDEEPRVLLELTVIDPEKSPTSVDSKPSIAQASVAQPMASPKKDKRVKSYMNPIGNMKNKAPGSAAPLANAQSAEKLKPNPSKGNMSSASRTAKVNKPVLPTVSKKTMPIQEIQKILD